jgi:hypothetical protein
MIPTLFMVLAFVAGVEGEPKEERPVFQAWYVDSLKQVLVTDPAPVSALPGRIDAARGEVEAIQVAVRSRTACRLTLEAGSLSPEMPVRIRTVGRVPIRKGTHRTPPEERVALPPVDLPDPARTPPPVWSHPFSDQPRAARLFSSLVGHRREL